MPTPRVRYVNTASSAGGDGTTNATAGANRAYATLAEALASEAGDLVTADENLELYFDGSGDLGTVANGDWTGFVTDATRNIYIGPIDDDVRAGTSWDSGKPKIAGASWTSAFVAGNSSNPFFELEGLQLSVPGGGNESAISTGITNDATIRIHGCLCVGLDGRNPARDQPIMSIQATNTTALIYNNILINEDPDDDVRALFETYSRYVYFYNNTLKGYVGAAGDGFSIPWTGCWESYIRNNIIEVSGGGDAYRNDSTLTDSDANITNDATSPDGASFQNLTATFVSSTDWALAAGDTNARDNGADLSADPVLPITIDIAGTSRPQNTVFDIGAFEYVSAGGPITLTTEAGAWVAGGADSPLDRTLATEPGSHAWTGALSTLARALLTEPGAWTVAGALSDLVRALSTQPGAWAYSGQDSEFFIGLTLSTEPGTWTHAGIDAPILRGLATEPGAWAWSGQDSELITGVVLVTEAGTWQLAGAEGLLIRNLDTEAGAHTWAGGDADLFTGIIIETEPGVWTLVGQLSDLPRNFDTEAGTWIQVGRDSSVVIPGQYYLEEAIAMAAQIIFDLRSNTTLTLDAGGANEVTNLRAIRQARSFDPNVGLRFVHSDETEFLIEKETPRDGAGDPIVGDVVLRRGMTLLDETNAESFVIRRIEYDRSGITRIGVVVP